MHLKRVSSIHSCMEEISTCSAATIASLVIRTSRTMRQLRTPITSQRPLQRSLPSLASVASLIQLRKDHAVARVRMFVTNKPNSKRFRKGIQSKKRRRRLSTRMISIPYQMEKPSRQRWIKHFQERKHLLNWLRLIQQI